MQISKFINAVVKEKAYPTAKNLIYELNYLFGDIDFRDKTVLDIGGGIGFLATYAALKGAKKSICLEPESDGSSSGMIATFKRIKENVNPDLNVELISSTLQDFMPHNKDKFDIIVLHNSINHLNEEATINLRKNSNSKKEYIEIFLEIHNMMNEGGILIFSDCTNRNIFNDIGLKSPFQPTIEWDKHQTPQVWSELISKCGFSLQNISYSSPNRMGKLGELFMRNKLAAYLTTGLFKVVMKAEPQTANMKINSNSYFST